MKNIISTLNSSYPNRGVQFAQLTFTCAVKGQG